MKHYTLNPGCTGFDTDVDDFTIVEETGRECNCETCLVALISLRLKFKCRCELVNIRLPNQQTSSLPRCVLKPLEGNIDEEDTEELYKPSVPAELA